MARETKEGQSKPVAGVVGEGTVGPAQRDRAKVRAGLHSGFLETLADLPGGDWLGPGPGWR